MLSPLGWVLFRTLQRLQCNCANKNALLTCENKKLTATKKNPGQFMLRGFFSVLPQLAGSLIRAVSGDGDARIRLRYFNPNWLFEVARQQNDYFVALIGLLNCGRWGGSRECLHPMQHVRPQRSPTPQSPSASELAPHRLFDASRNCSSTVRVHWPSPSFMRTKGEQVGQEVKPASFCILGSTKALCGSLRSGSNV